MTDENNDKVCRTLMFYQANGRKLHIKIIGGVDTDCFRNGFISDVSTEQRCFIFLDDVMGERTYLFEEVNVDSIVPYREKGEEE